MSKLSPAHERSVRIELVRARAALERQSLVHDLRSVGDSLRPSSLWRDIVPGFSSQQASSWLVQVWKLSRRYPLLASSLSSVLARTGRRKRWLRLAAGLLLSWQVARSMSRR